MPQYNSKLKVPARQLRSNQTDAELLLWSKIRKKQIAEAQFYRQRPLLNFIVDFYCPKAKLVIECDGSQHYTEQRLEKDAIRDDCLAELSILVLRYDNRQILTETTVVLEQIDAVVKDRLLTLSVAKEN